MNRFLAMGGMAIALCVSAHSASAQSSQGRDPSVAAPARVTTPPLRAPAHVTPAHVERAHPKTQERAVAPPAAPPTTAVAAGQPTPAPAANEAPPVETMNFQGWSVTCLPVPQDGSARTCVAKMGIIKSNEDRRPILYVNIIKTGGSAILAVQTPTTVDVKSGVTLQIGRFAPRHLDYASCEPALCTATLQMDDPFAQEFANSPNATVSWTGLGVGEVRVEYALQEARNTIAFLATR